MIYIDAREGLSGDMLLAAEIGLFDADARAGLVEDLSMAARTVGMGFHLMELEDRNEIGLGISYTGEDVRQETRPYERAVELLRRMHPRDETSGEPSCDLAILDALFRAEAEAHGVPVSEVHLHEIGRASALLNMYGIGRACSMLTEAGAGEFVSSTITTGKGVVVIAHGAVRVPAPACQSLLKGLNHVPGSEPGERATPTGIAAVKVLARTQSDEIPEKYRKRSVGYGTRRFGGRLGRTVLFWA